MHTHASLPVENRCTCGYLTPPETMLYHHNSTALTYQIGSLLIALGSIFGSNPLFRLHIKPATSQLLKSIGRKLIRSSGKSVGMYN